MTSISLYDVICLLGMFLFQVFDNVMSFGRYCGSSQPPVITSSSDVLEIHFESDGSLNGRGFTAYYADTGKIQSLCKYKQAAS